MLAVNIASKESFTYRSKQQIRCGHCKVSIRRDRLAEHTQKQHPGMQKLEEGQTSSRSILEMLGSKKRTHSENLEESTGVSLSKRHRVCELDKDEELEVTAPECQSMPGQREIAVDATSNSGIHAKLDKIIQMVSQMSLQRSDSRSHTSSMPSSA